MKRANGKGSIYFETSTERFVASFVAPSGKRVSKRFNSIPEAEAWLEDNRYNIRHNTYASPSNMRTGQWVLEYLKTYKTDVRPQTMTGYLNAVAKLSPIADIRLQKLTGLDIQQLANSLKGHISNGYIVRILQVLDMALKKAVALDILVKNPMATVERPKRTTKKIKIFTVDEVKAMLNYTATHQRHRLHMEILVAAYTGMRIGEILALDWRDITPSFIYVRRSLTKDGRGMPIIQNMTKTSHSTRQISIPPKVYDALMTWKEMTRSSGGLVFTTNRGSIIVPSNEREAFQKVQGALGILPLRSFHALRHTHASQLLAGGVPIAEVTKRLGHASPAITLGIYASWIPGNDAKIALDVDRIFK